MKPYKGVQKIEARLANKGRKQLVKRMVIFDGNLYGTVTVTLVAFKLTVNPAGALVVLKGPLRVPNVMIWKLSPGLGTKPSI